jgi:hypothetical protein
MSSPNNTNEIIKEGTSSYIKSPWITIEGTIITDQKGTNRLKLNAICYKVFNERTFNAGNSEVFLPNNYSDIYPKEFSVDLSEIIASQSITINKPNNDYELLSQFSGYNIYSLGSNAEYDNLALDKYKSAYNQWVDMNIKLYNVVAQTENDFDINAILKNAKQNLLKIQNELNGIVLMAANSYSVNTPENYKLRFNELTFKKNSITRIIANLEKVVNPDKTKIYINCINLSDEKCLYLMNINEKVSFSKYGLVPKENANEESRSIIQKMKNIKIDRESLIKVINHYKKISPYLLSLYGGNTFTRLSSRRRHKYSNKPHKHKRRKYSVKNK